ncbi:MAG: porin [Burkholderiaceae bacterium]
MNKALVSIAVLTVAGAASAQSSVTLYGRIDASLASQKTEVGGVTTVDPGAQIRSGAHTGSRWGFKGSEDLGSGLKANFQLEQGFNIDTGTASSARQFHRQAWVGLSGGFGSLQLGRQYSTIDNMYTEHDALGLSGYSAANYAFGAEVRTRRLQPDRRKRRVLRDTSPSFGGFQRGRPVGAGRKARTARPVRSRA